MMPLLLESKKDWPPMIPSGIIVVELLEAAVVGERVPDALTMGVLPDVLDEVGVIVIIVPTVGVLTMEGGMLLLLSSLASVGNRDVVLLKEGADEAVG